MMAANYQHIGGHENRLGRHYSRFSAFWSPAALTDQSLALRKSQNAGSNGRSRVSSPNGGDIPRCRPGTVASTKGSLDGRTKLDQLERFLDHHLLGKWIIATRQIVISRHEQECALRIG